MVFEGGPVVDLSSLPAERGQPRLLEQVRNAIRRRHYSYRTEQAYVQWIKRYIYFHGKRHPGEMGADEVTAFLTHLARLKGPKWMMASLLYGGRASGCASA